jgi:hypothetical protein
MTKQQEMHMTTSNNIEVDMSSKVYKATLADTISIKYADHEIYLDFEKVKKIVFPIRDSVSLTKALISGAKVCFILSEESLESQKKSLDAFFGVGAVHSLRSEKDSAFDGFVTVEETELETETETVSEMLDDSEFLNQLSGINFDDNDDGEDVVKGVRDVISKHDLTPVVKDYFNSLLEENPLQ